MVTIGGFARASPLAKPRKRPIDPMRPIRVELSMPFSPNRDADIWSYMTIALKSLLYLV
jgi:hypothetical protein